MCVSHTMRALVARVMPSFPNWWWSYATTTSDKNKTLNFKTVVFVLNSTCFVLTRGVTPRVFMKGLCDVSVKVLGGATTQSCVWFSEFAVWQRILNSKFGLTNPNLNAEFPNLPNLWEIPNFSLQQQLLLQMWASFICSPNIAVLRTAISTASSWKLCYVVALLRKATYKHHPSGGAKKHSEAVLLRGTSKGP